MAQEMDFWERPEVVAEFAAREPDKRLLPFLDRYADPAATRVLDLGCAAGRNTVLLAQRGFDVLALDSSSAMVEETRRRLVPLLGEASARQRVRLGRMDDVSAFDSASIHLVVALGILHNAGSWAEWQRAVAGLARVLRPGGHLLVAQFSPDVDLTGEGVQPIAGQPHLYMGLHDRAGILLRPDELDAEMAPFGFRPEVPTAVGETRTEKGRRVSVNGLYRKD